MKRENAGSWNSGLKKEQVWDTYSAQLQKPWKSMRNYYGFYKKYWAKEVPEGSYQEPRSLVSATYRPGGGYRACGPLAHPLRWIFAHVFFIFSINIIRKFSGLSDNFHFCTKTTPRQFCWKQRQSRLVPFKSCKLESKTRAKEFGKVDTMETYQLPQA